MAKIKVMDASLANKIAAGEVVERPSSVVKELVENAIDADATKIDIFLEEAGIHSIKVIDNGSGMDPEDAYLAFERHATSKLLHERDLFRIDTLGFRGEALPSIASVSDLTLQTSNGTDAGVFIHIRGGKEVERRRTSARKGTEIHVQHLFFNTPARLKYLKSINTELGYSIDFVNKIALSNPDIAFRLVHGDRTLLQTNGNGDVLNIISSIYGLDVAKKIHETAYSDQFMNVKLFLAEPEIYRTTRNYMTFVVNQRVVQNSDLLRSLVDGYEGYLPVGRYPVVVAVIEIDPLLIDVNVHPAKLEIRFSNHEQMRTILTDLVRKKLKDIRAIPKVQVRDFRKEKDPGIQQSFSFIERDPLSPETKFVDANPFHDEPTERHESINGIQKMERVTHESQKSAYPTTEDFSDRIHESVDDYIPRNDHAAKEQNSAQDDLQAVLPKLYYIGQLGGTYLLAQNDQGLYLIDQHAAEERINYEYYLEQLTKPKREYYELLVPETFEFSMNEAILIEKHFDQFEALNIGIEKFGLNGFIVTKVPNWFHNDHHRDYLEVVFQSILEGRDTSSEHLFSDLAATLSCKRSIKANWYISEYEVQALLDRLVSCQNPYRCPHGRPVVIQISFSEIEQMFKRTV